MIYDEIYSQNVEVDENISKLFDLQFSEFYKSFNNFPVLANFIKYRLKAYQKYLSMFKPTSNIFPTLLKYNFGINQLVDLDVVNDIQSKPYELITKRGGKQNFINILKALGVSTNAELVSLVNLDPIIIVGSESNKVYPSSLIKFVNAVEEITEDDLPLSLPIISSQYTINTRDIMYYDVLAKALLFDSPPSLQQINEGYTLEYQILMYHVLKQVLYKDYLKGDLQKYLLLNVITPTSNNFMYVLKLKYPLINTLSHSEQLDLLLTLRREYIKRKSDLVISTSNSNLNNLLNHDIQSGYFLTKLNKFWLERNLSIPEQYSNVYPTMVDDSDVLDMYYNYFLMISNTLYYLKKSGTTYKNLYPAILKYLSEVQTQDVLISDFTGVFKTIQKQINGFQLGNSDDYLLPFISIYQISKIISTKLDNYYPLYMAVADPSYIINVTSSILFTSQIETFSDPLYRAYYDYVEFNLEYFHLSYLIHEDSIIKVEDIETHFEQGIKESTIFELETDYHVTEIVINSSTITLTESEKGTQIVYQKENITIEHSYETTTS